MKFFICIAFLALVSVACGGFLSTRVLSTPLATPIGLHATPLISTPTFGFGYSRLLAPSPLISTYSSAPLAIGRTIGTPLIGGFGYGGFGYRNFGSFGGHFF